MYQLQQFLYDEEKQHTADWFNECVRYVRMYMSPLISKEDAARNMQYILGTQSLAYVENLFLNLSQLNLTNQNASTFRSNLLDRYGNPLLNPGDNPVQFINEEMKNIGFTSLPIMEKLKNVILSDVKKMGIVTNVRANDPTSKLGRENDKELMKNKARIERDLSYLYTSIGDQPYSIFQHEKRFGEKIMQGNLDMAEGMGMDMGDPQDVDFFFEHFYKLDIEIQVKKLMDALDSYNQMAEFSDMWGLDMIAKKCIAGKNYVSKLTGEILAEYATPETTYTFGGNGRRKDFNDAMAKCIEQVVTLRQALEIAGDSFDIEANFSRILMSLQTMNSIEFTGIEKGWQGFLNNGYRIQNKTANGQWYSWGEILSMNITMGYIEISSQIKVEKQQVQDKDGQYTTVYAPPKGTGKYATKPRYETPIYCGYYLALSQMDQIIFDFGKVPYQDITGSLDTQSRFSIITYKETGKPIGEMCIDYIDFINECFYKYKYIVRRSKAPGVTYFYPALVKLAEDLIQNDAVSKFDKVNQVMQMLDNSSNGMYDIVYGEDGKPLPIPAGGFHINQPNAVTQEALLYWKMMLDAKAELMDILGISPLREGDPGGSRDSVSNQFKALEYSIASTYYITDAITKLYRAISVRNLFYVQDIISYKNYDTMAYKWLENLVGKEVLDKIEALGKNALHRFGIFVESLNTLPLKAKLDAILANDQNTGKITTAEALLINDIKDPKSAWQLLAYFEQRNQKLQQKQAMQMQQAQAQQQQSMLQMQFNIEKMRLDNSRIIAGMNNQADIQGKGLTQQGGLAKQIVKENAASRQIYEQAYADLLASIKESGAAINQTANPMPPAPPQQGAPMSPQPQSPAMPQESEQTPGMPMQ